MSRFKKGELTKEAFDVIMHDLECLEIDMDKDNNAYHYDLLVGNIKDIFGIPTEIDKECMMEGYREYVKDFLENKDLSTMEDFDTWLEEEEDRLAEELLDNKKITIPFSEGDLEDLRRGKTFDWTFEGIDVHLFKGEEE